MQKTKTAWLKGAVHAVSPDCWNGCRGSLWGHAQARAKEFTSNNRMNRGAKGPTGGASEQLEGGGRDRTCMSGFGPETTASSDLLARRESELEQQLLFAFYRVAPCL